MITSPTFRIGTSGFSFKDWVGTFYPAGTRSGDMLGQYVRHFDIVELNFTYYRMPTARTIERLATVTPDGFLFWVKANQETTHKYNRGVCGQFIENVQPMAEAGKLAGVLLQFPQSFHRTVETRKYLAGTLDDFESLPLAVEFRHRSWEHPSVASGLRDRNVTLVVPDVPDLDGLFHSPAVATTATGYLRLHSRTAEKWYAGGAERYDYNYSREEMSDIIRDWTSLDEPLEQVFAFFNNCHRGQAAENAEAFSKLLEEM